MRRVMITLAFGAAALGAAAGAQAHAFLDHASPAVGGSVPTAPAVVTLWFTQDLEPVFSNVTVTNEAGQRVDLGNTRIPPGSPAELQIGLKPLALRNLSGQLECRLCRYPPDRRHFYLRSRGRMSLSTGPNRG